MLVEEKLVSSYFFEQNSMNSQKNKINKIT